MTASTSKPERKPYRYKTAWKTSPEGFTPAELQAENLNGSDAVASVATPDGVWNASVLLPPDGTYSLYFSSIDGRTGEQLDDNEWFKIWMMLSKRLAASRTLDPGKREFCEITFDALRKILFGNPDRSCGNPGCAGNHEAGEPHKH